MVKESINSLVVARRYGMYDVNKTVVTTEMEWLLLSGACEALGRMSSVHRASGICCGSSVGPSSSLPSRIGPPGGFLPVQTRLPWVSVCVKMF